MKLQLTQGGLSVENDAQAMKKLIEKMDTIRKMIDLFNESDWQVEEVSMWIQYEKDLALLQSKIYTGTGSDLN